MIKVSAVVISMLLLLVAVPSYAVFIDYQDTGGTHELSVAGDWWALTSGGDPNTRAYSGLPGFSDNAYIRTGRSDLTFSSGTLNAKGMMIGGESFTANPPTTTTVVTATAGTIETRAVDDTGTSNNLYIGYRYNATLTVDGATVKAMTADGSAGSMLSLGGKGAATTGTLNLISGEVQFGRIYAAWNNGIAVINHSGGTMRQVAGGNTFFGQTSTAANAKATYNLSGTGLLSYGSGQWNVGYRGGKSLFNQTGGSAWFGATGTGVNLGRSDQAGSPTTDSELRILGGRMTLAGSMQIGVSGYARGKLLLNQTGQLDMAGSLTSVGSATYINALELIVGSASNFQVTVGGNLNVGSNIGFRITLDSYAPTVGQTWRVATVGGTTTLPLDGYHPLAERYDFSNEDGLGWCLYKDAGNEMYLEYVPEPATLTLLGLGGLALLRRKRS